MGTPVPTAVATYPVSGTAILTETHGNYADLMLHRMDLLVAIALAGFCVLAFSALFLSIAHMRLGTR